MAEEIDKEQLQQSGSNRTAHALYASGSIYEATKVGVATKIQILVRPKPDQPDRLLRPCFSPMKSPESVGAEGVVSLLQVHLHQLTKVQDPPPHSIIHR